MRIFEKNGTIVITLNLGDKKYIRSFFSKQAINRWIESLEGGCR